MAGTSRPAADILLELLTKVPDASTLELLLDTNHLAVLLRLHGWSDADIRRELGGGGSPGELLLQLLTKEPDTTKLLAELGRPAPAPARKKTAAAAPTLSRAASSVIGLVLAVPSGWYLFFRLDVINAPGLIKHFPGAYALYFGLLLTGLMFLVKGVLAKR